MNRRHFTLGAAMLACAMTSCDKPAGTQNTASAADEAMRRKDTPILPVNLGDSWIYRVRLFIPADVTSPGAAEVNTNHERVRTYLGKQAAAAGLPPTDCFEVTVPGSPPEREFVEIHEDRILMRGSLVLREDATKPMWLDQPVPFVIAGMKPGTAMPGFQTAGGGLSRRTEVIAREQVSVPAGNFEAIRLLTTGRDGDLELRRTIWFTPRTGIVREEKIRYRADKLVFREIQELAAIRRAR